MERRPLGQAGPVVPLPHPKLRPTLPVVTSLPLRHRSATVLGRRLRSLLQGTASGHLFESATYVSLLQFALATGSQLVPVWGFNKYCIHVI
jgi:hypothetical protein